MDYYLIEGNFHVVGYSPDGDSLMFEASNPSDWSHIQSHHKALFEEKLKDGNGSVQLRLQGIDALETHYSPTRIKPPSETRGKSYSKAEKPKPKNYQQPFHYGEQATHKLLSYLGVEEINWRSRFGHKYIRSIEVAQKTGTQSFKVKGEDALKGFIIVNDIDRKGRPISWVFGGKSPIKSGSHMDTAAILDLIKQSVNYRLVANGMVYPYFFMTLEAKLRQPLIHGVRNAQRQTMNLWSEDQTQEGIFVNGISELNDEKLIFPYIFRRIVRHQFQKQMEGYWEAVIQKKSYKADPECLFLESFFEHTNPYVFKIDERDFVRLDQVLVVEKNKLRLATHPGNIIFLS